MNLRVRRGGFLVTNRSQIPAVRVSETDILSSAFPKSNQRQGYLEARTKETKPWKRRFFVLNNNFLLSASTPCAAKLDKVIPMGGAIIAPSDQSDLEFEMNIRKHTLFFRVSKSPHSCIEWINALQKASKFRIKDSYRCLSYLTPNKNIIQSRHRQTNEGSVIKICDKRLYNKSKLKTQMQLLKKIKNSNVVSIYDMIETKKYLYIVMEQCEGGKLLDRLRDAINSEVKIEEDWCCDILYSIVSGIQHMHDSGIILNYFTADNILCMKPDNISEVKIVDFGLKNVLTDPQSQMTNDQMSYMAPELLSEQKFGVETIPKEFVSIVNHFYKTVPADIILLLSRFYYSIDHASDSWSVGVIMFVLLMGYKPFVGKESILNDDIDKVFNTPDWNHVPITVKSILQRLLVKNPFERKSYNEVLKAKWKIDTNSLVLKNW